MSPPVPAIAELRETLRSIEGDVRVRPVLPFGIGEMDGRLADAGLRLDALHEVSSRGGGWGDDAAAVLFAAGVAARTKGPVLWVVRCRDLFAPGLYQAGLDPARVVYADTMVDVALQRRRPLMADALRKLGGLASGQLAPGKSRKRQAARGDVDWDVVPNGEVE